MQSLWQERALATPQRRVGVVPFSRVESNLSRGLELPVQLKLGERFTFRPVLPLLTGDGTYYLLAVSGAEVRLLEPCTYDVLLCGALREELGCHPFDLEYAGWPTKEERRIRNGSFSQWEGNVFDDNDEAISRQSVRSRWLVATARIRCLPHSRFKIRSRNCIARACRTFVLRFHNTCPPPCMR